MSRLLDEVMEEFHNHHWRANKPFIPESAWPELLEIVQQANRNLADLGFTPTDPDDHRRELDDGTWEYCP